MNQSSVISGHTKLQPTQFTYSLNIFTFHFTYRAKENIIKRLERKF